MKFRFPTLLSAVALGFALICGHARAMQAADPSTLVSQLVKQAIAIIVDKQAADADREAKFRDLLQTGFDIPRISRFVLGRYWNGANDQQRQQFTRLFEDWIVRTYSARFGGYSGETIQVTGTRPESDTTTVVLSQFVSPNGGPPAKVEWHVRKNSDTDFEIVDVSVEGVSMALTQRDEIASVADRSGGSVEGLNQALEQKISAAATAAGK
ncbi:MAG TPA: ABC transporter substrate-binding protein [Stellaceae bacterium]|jgi:phospholipid transport system substrate-binding protein|nr:ABC transporter substrate-binding protein [Stellaceae bacterium]